MLFHDVSLFYNFYSTFVKWQNFIHKYLIMLPLFRPLFLSHRCDCLRLRDKSVVLAFSCHVNSWLHRPGELEPLNSCRVQCMLGHPPAKRGEQGAVHLFEICGQPFWTQYHLSACQEALWHKQNAQNISLTYRTFLNYFSGGLIMTLS